MIFIPYPKEVEKYQLSNTMKAQIHLFFLSFYPIQVKILETEKEYYGIQGYVEHFCKTHSFLKSIGYTREDLKEHVIFPLDLYTVNATIFYIPDEYIKHLK